MCQFLGHPVGPYTDLRRYRLPQYGSVITLGKMMLFLPMYVFAKVLVV